MSPTLRRRDPQPGGAQPANELPAVDLVSPGGNHPIAVLLWYVIVVALEAATRYPGRRREGVELGQRLVRHEMAPSPAPPPPQRLVDQHGHDWQHRTGDARRRHGPRCLVAPRPPPGDTESP
jgi:hypothetical protein